MLLFIWFQFKFPCLRNHFIAGRCVHSDSVNSLHHRPLSTGRRRQVGISLQFCRVFKIQRRLYSLFRCFACCKKKAVTRIQMDIEPYFTELNSLAKYGLILFWLKEKGCSLLLSHTLTNTSKIFLLFISYLAVYPIHLVVWNAEKLLGAPRIFLIYSSDIIFMKTRYRSPRTLAHADSPI